jgi:uncharacterized protein (DUF433 family)
MSIPLKHPHVELRDGVPYVEGTCTRVTQVVLDQIAYGWNADEIQREHPYLTLAQVRGALAYYRDHQAEIDAAVEEEERLVDEMRSAHDSTPRVRDKLFPGSRP